MKRHRPPTTGSVTTLPPRNATLSAEERDRMFELLIEHNPEWFDKAVREIGRLPPRWKGTGEDIRYHILERLDDPHKPQIWGPVTKQGEKLGWLRKIKSRRGRMKQVSSHARSTDRYVRTDKPC